MPLAAIRTWVATIARLGLAAVWFWAGGTKIGDPAASLRAVRAYRALPEWLVHAVGYGLPYLEISLAILLLLGLATRLAAIVSAVLLAVFVAGIASAAARGLQIDCGCFGGGGSVAPGKTKYTLDILRDSGLLILSVALAFWPASRFSVDEQIARGRRDPIMARGGSRRTAEGRKRAEALAEKRRNQAKRRGQLTTAYAAVVLVAISAIGVGIQAARNKPPRTVAVPAAAMGNNGRQGIQVGDPNAKSTIDIYEDFQCPICRSFEQASGQTIQQLIDEKKAKVNYRIVAILNGASTTDYSTRSASAAGCASDAGVFPTYHIALFANQPPENSAGLSNDQLTSLAKQVGAPDTIKECIDSEKYGAWSEETTDAMSRAGITGTPTVLINGKRVTDNGAPPGPDTIRNAVQ